MSEIWNSHYHFKNQCWYDTSLLQYDWDLLQFILS